MPKFKLNVGDKVEVYDFGELKAYVDGDLVTYWPAACRIGIIKRISRPPKKAVSLMVAPDHPEGFGVTLLTPRLIERVVVSNTHKEHP